MRVRTLASVVAGVVVVAGVITLAQDTPPPVGEPVEPALVADAAFLIEPAPVPEADDPIQAVEEFVQRGRETAAQQVAALTEERDRLQARLQRVEAALQRWQAVGQCLGEPSPAPDEPAELIFAPDEPVGPVEPSPAPDEPVVTPDEPAEPVEPTEAPALPSGEA